MVQDISYSSKDRLVNGATYAQPNGARISLRVLYALPHVNLSMAIFNPGELAKETKHPHQ
jgi:hypothetical protein